MTFLKSAYIYGTLNEALNKILNGMICFVVFVGKEALEVVMHDAITLI